MVKDPLNFLANHSRIPIKITAGQSDKGPAAVDEIKSIINGMIKVVIGSNTIEKIAAIKPNQSSITLKIIQALYSNAKIAKILKMIIATEFGFFEVSNINILSELKCNYLENWE